MLAVMSEPHRPDTAAGSLLVITGPPGAGKSTVARLIADRLPSSVLVEGDAFFAFLASGAIEPWLPESHGQNHVVTAAAAAATATFVDGGYATVYDGVLGPWFLPHFIASSGLRSFDYALLLPPAEDCVRRVVDRVGHGFDDEAATRHMHEQFTAADLDDRHVFVNPTGDAEATAQAVLAASSAGELRLGSDGVH